MSLIGNLLWIFLGGGILVSLCYLVGGIVLCATIVGIPFGVQCFKLRGWRWCLSARKWIPAARPGGCSPS